MLRSNSKSRSGYFEFGHKKRSSALIRSISGSKICRGDALASQVDKEALVSVDRKSISLSENRIVKAAIIQKQMGDLEAELKSIKEKLDAAEREKNRALAELRETKESGLSPTRAEQVFSELKSLKDSLSNSRKEIEARDKEMTLLNSRLEAAKALELKLKEKDASIQKLQESKDSESKKRIRELEEQVEKVKQSESSMLDSLMFQTQQMEQTKMDLEESKLEVAALQEQLEKLQRGGKSEGFRNESMILPGKIACQEINALKDEIRTLKNELKLATEAEENSKTAMDGLASALKEVATEASTATEKLKLAEDEMKQLKEKINELNKEIEIERNTSEQLRVEAEESYLAWSGKEMGFITCIKRADEESAMAKHENNRLKEAIVTAENNTRMAREEAFKLRDLLKQAINESNVAKEAANIARAENSQLKDLLAEKEDALHFLTKENERLRINEVAARENVKEFKRLLAAKAEYRPPMFDDKEQTEVFNPTDVFNSPVSSLYEDHLDGRTTPLQTFSFDLDDLKIFNKEEDNLFNKEEEEEEEEYLGTMVVDDDPEKAEALKGSIFDTNASPRSEPQTPKLQQRRDGDSVQYEDGENHSSSHSHSHSHSHTEDTEHASYYMNPMNMSMPSFSKKKLFRKIGDIVTLKPYISTKKEGSTDQPTKEQAKEQGKEQQQAKEQGKEQQQNKEQGKEQQQQEEEEANRQAS